MRDATVEFQHGLAIAEWGNPDGPEIVFVHGVSQSRLAFARQRDAALANGFRLISYDLRGHGDSDKPESEEHYSGAANARDLHDVLLAKRVRRPLLVGWSLGGRIIAKYAEVHGEGSIAGINLVSVRAPDAYAGNRGPASAHIRGMISVDPEERDAATIDFLHAQVACPLGPEDLDVMRRYNEQCPVHARMAMLNWTRDFEPDFHALKVPVLMTHGTADAVAAPGAVAQWAAHLGARLSMYDGVGHMPFWEEPDRFNAELAGFAQSLAEAK